MAPIPTEPQSGIPPQNIYIMKPQPTNGLGVAGFIVALIGLFLFWVPVLNWIIWLLGLIFSFIGIFSKPRGLAVAGLIISIVNFLLIVAIIAFISSLLSGWE